MDDFHFRVFCGILVGFLIGALAGAYIATSQWHIATVKHGYGQWCADRSFAWQHEECE